MACHKQQKHVEEEERAYPPQKHDRFLRRAVPRGCHPHAPQSLSLTCFTLRGLSSSELLLWEWVFSKKNFCN